MVLSDRSICDELAAGRIVIEPLRDGSFQPSSVDLHVDRYSWCSPTTASG